MKYIVIGLGHLGAVLAQRLTEMGHEVIGVDFDEERVEEYKDSIFSTIRIDVKNSSSVSVLPLDSADAVFVTISNDFGLSVYTAAMLKQKNVKRIIARATSPLQRNVLEALGITEILTPERDYAEALAARFELSGSNHAMILSDEYVILEITAPKVLVGQSLSTIGFEENFGLRLITIKRAGKERIFGVSRRVQKIVPQWNGTTVVEPGDILVLFGKVKDFQKLKEV